jgi:hypothetical protein
MIRMIKEDELCGACSTHGEMYTKYWSVILKGRDLGRPRHRWADIKMNLKEGRVWTGFIWIRILTSGGIL